MAVLNAFALIVLITTIVLTVAVLVVLAMVPGRVAESRGHPQADAIKVAGWVGILLFGVLWPLALIWAYYKPGATAGEEVEA